MIKFPLKSCIMMWRLKCGLLLVVQKRLIFCFATRMFFSGLNNMNISVKIHLYSGCIGVKLVVCMLRDICTFHISHSYYKLGAPEGLPNPGFI